MSYFLWGIIFLFLATTIYYIVFASLVYYWHETNVTLILLPVIYTFEFFVIAFICVVVFALAAEYLPLLFTYL